MSSSARAPSHSDSRRTAHFFFYPGKSATKPLKRVITRDCGCGENLEDLHQQECQPVLFRQTLLNYVLRKNLEDLPDYHDYEELQCPRSAPQLWIFRFKILYKIDSIVIL